jgi:hypothetical protein
MEGNASEIFVRSTKAMVYMMKATGMMCSQRCEGITIGPETTPQHISSHARLATASATHQTSLGSAGVSPAVAGASRSRTSKDAQVQIQMARVTWQKSPS